MLTASPQKYFAHAAKKDNKGKRGTDSEGEMSSVEDPQRRESPKKEELQQKKPEQQAQKQEQHKKEEPQKKPAEAQPAAQQKKPEQQQPPKRAASDQSDFKSPDVRKIDSFPGDHAPVNEESIPGRYASVLFTTASREKQLHGVYEDMYYLLELYKKVEQFKLFTENAGLSKEEIVEFNKGLADVGQFQGVTFRFIELLGENKRFMYIGDIAEKYLKYYQLVSKEEKITIISAYDLNKEEKNQVLEALKKNPENEGKEFQLAFTVDQTIVGGLQMYTESKFMDMSLASRIDKINTEISKLIE